MPKIRNMSTNFWNHKSDENDETLASSIKQNTQQKEKGSRKRERERTQVRARKSKTQSGSQRGTDGKKKKPCRWMMQDMFSCMIKEQEFCSSSYVTRARDKRLLSIAHFTCEHWGSQPFIMENLYSTLPTTQFITKNLD
jgi:hypothetical protein